MFWVWCNTPSQASRASVNHQGVHHGDKPKGYPVATNLELLKLSFPWIMIKHDLYFIIYCQQLFVWWVWLFIFLDITNETSWTVSICLICFYSFNHYKLLYTTGSLWQSLGPTSWQMALSSWQASRSLTRASWIFRDFSLFKFVWVIAWDDANERLASMVVPSKVAMVAIVASYREITSDLGYGFGQSHLKSPLWIPDCC